jgi:hypothetical protein
MGVDQQDAELGQPLMTRRRQGEAIAEPIGIIGTGEQAKRKVEIAGGTRERPDNTQPHRAVSGRGGRARRTWPCSGTNPVLGL